MEVKIAMLNLCLGLKYKKLMVEQIRNSNKVDILCLQEVELESGFCENSLIFHGNQESQVFTMLVKIYNI